MATARRTTKAPCRRCLCETTHKIVGQRNRGGTGEVEGVGTVSWSDVYEMLECAGCETVSLRNTHWFSEESGETTTYYPPAVSRRMPSWRYETPYPIAQLMGEVYVALHNDSRRLALMGLRTIVDELLVHKVGDVGIFATKLSKLQEQGFIGDHNLAILEAALEAGHAAAHRGHTPAPKELNEVLDIVENLLQSVYVLGKAAASLKKTTPPRPKKKAQ